MRVRPVGTVDELQDYYDGDLPIRIEKTNSAEKFPDLAFVGKHLIPLKAIIKGEWEVF